MIPRLVMRTLVRPVTVLVQEQARSALSGSPSGSRLYPVQFLRVRSSCLSPLVLLPVHQLVTVATAYTELGIRKTADVDPPCSLDLPQCCSFGLVLCSVDSWFYSAKASDTAFEVDPNQA